MVPNFPYWGKKKAKRESGHGRRERIWGESCWFCSALGLGKIAITLSTSSHRQMSDVIKGHLQMVKAQGQDERVSLEEGCQAVTHSALH